MALYKVLESFELDGATQEVDSQVELTDEQAAELAGKVEAVEPSETSDDVDAGTPTPSPAAEGQQADAPEVPAAPSGETAEPKEEGWAGNHSVGRE